MGEVPLARLWQLPDGTSCLLLKDGGAGNWRLCIIRGGQTFRSEHFGSPIVAMDQAKQWRTSYDPSVEASRSSRS
jgi:hypothetical protein